jgi:hypothetical protein
MEKIMELSKNYNLDAMFCKKAKTHLDYVCHRLNITPIQAALFSHLTAIYVDRGVRTDELCNSLGCSRLQIMQYKKEFRALENKKLLSSDTKENVFRASDVKYRIPPDVLSSLEKDEEYKPLVRENISINKLFLLLEDLYEARIENEISFIVLFDELSSLLKNNTQLVFSKKITELRLGRDDTALLLYFFHLYVNNNEESTGVCQAANIFGSKSTTAGQALRLLSPSGMDCMRGSAPPANQSDK